MSEPVTDKRGVDGLAAFEDDLLDPRLDPGPQSGVEPVTIVPYKDGPYLVRGPFSLRDPDGEPIPVSRRTIALCRCGKSRTRPFCDGTHKLIGFRAPGSGETWPPDPEQDPDDGR